MNGRQGSWKISVVVTLNSLIIVEMKILGPVLNVLWSLNAHNLLMLTVMNPALFIFKFYFFIFIFLL